MSQRSQRFDGGHVETPPGPFSSQLVRASNPESLSRGHVLVIDHRLPTPDRDCGSLRMMEILRRFLEHGQQVSFIPDDMNVIEPYHAELRGMGVEVVHPPDYRSVADFLLRRGSEMKLAVISRADVAERHMMSVRCLAPSARVVFDTVDLHFLREARQAEITQDPELWTTVAIRKNQELRLAKAADLTLVVSPIEKAVLEQECPDEIEVKIVPTIYRASVEKPPGFHARENLIFIGGFEHTPNVDAVFYFAREILPRIQDRIPQAIFQVIGPDPTLEIRQLASPSIQILGFVHDVKPLFDRARVSVAPIRFGAGVKGKVNQSMALGVPTVVTSVAAEGMYLIHEQSAMIADDPDRFADAVVRLCTSRELWETVSVNGLRSLAAHFSVEAAAKPIDELLTWAGLALTDRSA